MNECNEGDNGIFYWTITVLPPPQPNLTKSTDNLNNSTPHPGDTITTSLTITNESCTGGSANAGTFHVGFYGLSTSTSFTGLTPFYELPVNGCAANGTVSTNLNITINAATAPGTYYLGYKIDDENEIAECNEGDNGINYWTVTVTQPDTTPPTISITSPTSAATYLTNVSSINLGGTASDNVGVTQVTWSNNRGGSGTASGTTAWSITGIALQSGANLITVVAYDAAGNTNQAALTVTYDTTPPTISITSPTSGSTYLTNVSSINLGGTASDSVGVTQVTWSNNRGGSGTASGTTAWSITGIALQSGTNLITVVARDTAGNTNQAVLTVTNDTTPPTVNITSPTSGSTYLTNVSSINLGGTASDSVGVTQVTWSNNRGGNGTASGTTAWSITGISLQGGTNIITVTAHDTAGNSGSATLSVKYNLPALGIVRQNGNIVLTWPTNAADFTLENATNLPATVWTTNSSSSYIVNGQITVTNTLTNGSKFYRLLKP